MSNRILGALPLSFPVAWYPLTAFPASPNQIAATILETVTGKQAQSSNFFVGVDRVTLTMLTRSQ